MSDNETEVIETTPELQEEQPQQPQVNEQQQFSVVDTREMPLALKNLIDSANKTLQETQQKLLDEITESSNELMAMMQLNQQEGWLVDIQSKKFVQVAVVSEEDSE